MIILQDSREQSPLIFVQPEVSEVKITKLIVGDYTAILANGYQAKTIFERKAHGDLFGTLTKDYGRFKDEVMRAKDNDIALILIVEGSLSKIMAGFKHSGVKGISIIKTLFTLWIRYGIHPVFCKDREEVSEFIVHYFWAQERHLLTMKKEE